MKNFVKKLVRTTGHDIIKTRLTLIDFMNERRIDRVVDVGANAGQFVRLLRRIGYNGDILSLEPISTVFLELKARCEGDPKWKGLNLAAGDEDSAQEIGISENSVYSSMKKTTAAAEQFDLQSRLVATELIKVVRLDTLLADLTGNILLKIDTQGYEANVISGAQEFLKRVSLVQMELPCVHLYEGVWSMADALSRMEDLGFTLFHAQPVNFSRTDRIAPVELDCLFGRPQ